MAVNDGRVVSNFIVQSLKNEDITIYGDGSRTRSFCYVNDLIEGLYLLMNSDIKSPVNLGNPGEFTMLELAQKILAKTGSKSNIIYKPIPEDDPQKEDRIFPLQKQNLIGNQVLHLTLDWNIL